MLIAVWAVVLVPMWAHRGQVPPESDVSAGARVISRRPQRPRPQWLVRWRSLLAGLQSSRTVSLAGGFTSGAATRAATLRQRRTVLAGLTAALLITAVGILFGLPARLLLLPALPAAGYLVWLRQTTAHAAALREQRRRRLAAQRAAGFRDFGASEAAPAAPATPAGADLETRLVSSLESNTAAGPAATAPTHVDGDPSTGQDAGPSTVPWLPVPLPLPSYVTASPSPRVIDGNWHEEVLLDGELPGEASAYALGEDDQRRRAVGD